MMPASAAASAAISAVASASDIFWQACYSVGHLPPFSSID